MTLLRPPKANLKMTDRDDCAVSACSAPPNTHTHTHTHTHTLFLKARIPCLLGHGGRRARQSTFGQMSATLPIPSRQLPASEIKRMFLSSNLARLLTFEPRAAEPHHTLFQ